MSAIKSKSVGRSLPIYCSFLTSIPIGLFKRFFYIGYWGPRLFPKRLYQGQMVSGSSEEPGFPLGYVAVGRVHELAQHDLPASGFYGM